MQKYCLPSVLCSSFPVLLSLSFTLRNVWLGFSVQFIVPHRFVISGLVCSSYGNWISLVCKAFFRASNHFHCLSMGLLNVDSCNCIIVFSMFILFLYVLILFSLHVCSSDWSYCVSKTRQEMVLANGTEPPLKNGFKNVRSKLCCLSDLHCSLWFQPGPKSTYL